MLKGNAGFWGGFASFIFSLVFLIVSFQYSYTSGLGPGPGFLPRWISGLMVVLSIFYMLESIKKPMLLRDLVPPKEGLWKIFWVIVSILVYFAILKSLGFMVANTVFVFLLLRKEYRWYYVVGIAIAISLIFYLIFVVMLNVPLPVNALGW